ncbi:clarin-3 [Harmonia axyridis]|uniref:clarin-3 n=1 Tax=Harmonia axyridis TaxID=115357 RepID=UPI001E277F5B|nr:clarin-3 [Harmonia axyridis]
MSLMKRGMIFITFFGSCLAMALTIVSLGTKFWITSRAKRTSNPLESDGIINFGLFDGKKELNVAYGWRSYDIDVLHLLKFEPEFMNYSIWLGTVVTVCGSLVFSALGAVFTIITVSRRSKYTKGSVKLYLWNFLALLSQIGAIILWLVQFYMKLQYNVLSREDKDNMWSSEGLSELGYSFWCVTGAAAATLCNIFIICIANSDDDVEQVISVVEEKTNGAIMLY